MLTIIVSVCCLSCVAFPYIVGPIDTAPDNFCVHDPDCHVQPADSPAGTAAYAEVGPQEACMPGCIVLNVRNNTDNVLHNVLVRLPLAPRMVIDKRALRHGFNVEASCLEYRFSTLAAHDSSYQAVDYVITNGKHKGRRTFDWAAPLPGAMKHLPHFLAARI